MNNVKHTPTPWSYSIQSETYANVIHTAAARIYIGDTVGADDAVHIVKCVNMHAHLLAGLKESYKLLQVYGMADVSGGGEAQESLNRFIVHLGEVIQAAEKP